MLIRLCTAALLACTFASAQPPRSAPATSTHPLAFDVVTIKRSGASAGPPTIQSSANGDSIIITNMSPRMILGFAYDVGLHDMIYGLPAWADSDTYDVTAKVAESDLPAFRSLLPRQRNPMLQQVLADRFHLKVHTEPKEIPAYALVIAKGGPKLKAAEPSVGADGRRGPGGIRMSRGEIAGDAAPIAPLLDALSHQLGRPVIDRTGLTGHYNFTLQFAPAQASTETPADAGPSIFTAVQDQLGLKLESTKAPIPVLVIDHIEKPSEN